MARRSIGKPRFYADIPQYLKTLGYYDGSNSPEVWNMNPSQPTEYESDEGFNVFEFIINKPSEDIDHLLTTIPQSDVSGLYAGVLGHDIKDKTVEVSLIQKEEGLEADLGYVIDFNEIKNYYNSPEYNGYSLWDITEWNNTPNNINTIRFAVEGEQVSIGCNSFGRWFEPEFSFDLKGTIANNYEGVNVQNTVGGSTLSNIKHLGQPNWGELPAWTLEKQEERDYNLGGAKGRRSWKVGFSYLTDDKIFNKAGNPDKFFTYDEDTEQHTFDTSLGSFLKLTLNGKLPFIFCPDSSADDLEFALCRVTNQPSFSQVANNLFSTSLTITETW